MGATIFGLEIVIPVITSGGAYHDTSCDKPAESTRAFFAKKYGEPLTL
jgi:hypothetical protein